MLSSCFGSIYMDALHTTKKSLNPFVVIFMQNNIKSLYSVDKRM